MHDHPPRPRVRTSGGPLSLLLKGPGAAAAATRSSLVRSVPRVSREQREALKRQHWWPGVTATSGLNATLLDSWWPVTAGPYNLLFNGECEGSSLDHTAKRPRGRRPLSAAGCSGRDRFRQILGRLSAGKGRRDDPPSARNDVASVASQ